METAFCKITQGRLFSQGRLFQHDQEVACPVSLGRSSEIYLALTSCIMQDDLLGKITAIVVKSVQSGKLLHLSCTTRQKQTRSLCQASGGSTESRQVHTLRQFQPQQAGRKRSCSWLVWIAFAKGRMPPGRCICHRYRSPRRCLFLATSCIMPGQQYWS